MAIEKELLDQLLAGRDPKEVFAKDGLLDELKKALAERILNAEMDDHLEGETRRRQRQPPQRLFEEDGSDRHVEDDDLDPARPGRDLRSAADRQVPAALSRLRRQDHLDVCARHERARDPRPSAELYGIDVSPDLISAVTDAVLEEVAEWQNRPLEACYPLVFFDAIRVKIRDEGFVRNKAVYIALGVLPGRHQGDPRPLDRADRGRQVLAAGHERAEEPRRRGRPDRRRRWPEGLSRGDQRRLPADPRADLHRPPDPPFAGVRVVEGPQGGRAGAAGRSTGPRTPTPA